jgi:hypothetical protein
MTIRFSPYPASGTYLLCGVAAPDFIESPLFFRIQVKVATNPKDSQGYIPNYDQFTINKNASMGARVFLTIKRARTPTRFSLLRESDLIVVVDTDFT